MKLSSFFQHILFLKSYYMYKLTTSKTFSFLSLFRMKIPNSLLASAVYSLFPH
ncbi:conserved hypothetical protein [Listeria monocytogenes FSL N1-017]|nr:hypothetical protein LMOh7858_1008 [Listeria monocytogenes str. 4b H7858] [Listeria monocytogenes serotype 4b str. H7858]EFG00765.1 conserved hypothetical protein [Listeria monocytogenes FSL J1-194]EFK42198.1 conserved hypothetical protein [Listeria monocytogenes FSL N1-017]